jgi:hypothetical protein
MRLGLIARNAKMPALLAGVTRSGWVDVSKPTIDSFYDMSALRAVCEAPLGSEGWQLSHWTKSVLAQKRPTSTSLYEICALHSMYGTRLARMQAKAMREKVTSNLRRAERNKSPSLPVLAESYVAATTCGVRVDRRTIPIPAWSPKSATTFDAYAAFVMESASSTRLYSAGIRQFLGASRSGSGFGYKIGAGTADVYSTDFALDIHGARASARIASLRQFRGQGAWLLEVPSIQYPQKEATLGSLLQVAFIAMGGTHQGLCPLFRT